MNSATVIVDESADDHAVGLRVDYADSVS